MKRSKFSLSNYKLLSMNQGQLVPIGLTEVLPGDTFQHSTSALIRVAPLATPVMHPVHATIHHWFVPHRLVWNDWENFITGGPDGMNASVFPTISSGVGFPVGSLADYMGVPTYVPNLSVSALPFRGYALIWNEWYRDQDLQTPLTIDKTDGADTTTNTDLQYRAWEKDYFTSARPFTQKGPEVTLPLGTEAPVIRDTGSTAATLVRNASTGALVGSVDLYTDSSSRPTSAAGTPPYMFDPNGNLLADLSDASAASVNDIRLAMALQRYEEARARYGSRYTEYLRYLGVKSSDARLQRPEYLGGGKQTVQFSEVLQTAPFNDGVDTTPVGELRGHGIAAMKSNRYRRFFEEHGYVFTFMSVLPKTVYANGLPRTWNRRTKEDFFQKELQHIGQQEVLYKEVYASQVSNGGPNGTFGYQDRYDEYRRQESSIAGEFRTDLSDWHMARIFSGDIALNADFVKSNPTTRIYSSSATNQLYVMARHSIQARRIVAQEGTSFIY